MLLDKCARTVRTILLQLVLNRLVFVGEVLKLKMELLVFGHDLDLLFV